MLRHTVFALVLVGAAFAGGAAINGPGLTWLQRTVLGGPTIIVDGASQDAPAAAPKRSHKPFPTAKGSPLVVDLPPAPQPKKKKPADPTPEEAEPLLPPESPSALIRAAEPPMPELGPEPTPPTSPARQASAPSTRPKAPASPDPGPGPSPKADPVARLASAGPASTPPDRSTAPDWPEIRRRMQALGIARYSMEAEIDGRVKFSCVIPVEGLRAVGHHFEAEGDDEAQAAEAALRRVTLWQATELPKESGAGPR